MLEPTRVTEASATILDQFISNFNERVKNVQVIEPIANSDHCTIFIEIEFGVLRRKSYSRMVWDYNKGNYPLFKEKLQSTDWEHCFQNTDLNINAEAWTNTFLNVAKQCIPLKIVKIYPNDKPFYNSTLRKLKRQIVKVRKKAIRLGTEYWWNSYRPLRNEYNRSLENAKIEYDLSLRQYLWSNRGHLSQKKWWKIAKSFLGQNTKSYIPPLIVNDDILTDNKSKASAFNDYFIEQTKIETNNSNLPRDIDIPEKKLESINFTHQDISDLLKSIDISKAHGPDSVSGRMLKEAGDSIVPSLFRLFKLSLETCKFPNIWKLANVIPLYKKNNAETISNYRPVSLLSLVGKLLERVIFKYMYNFLKDNNIITVKQSGFKPGDSTVCQLSQLYHMFSKALDEKKDIRIVFCDISKAFDRVWHDGILYKLNKIGISGKILSWFENYLSDRQQRVVINGENSNYGRIHAGVPQGSILGPLLFLVYINDLVDVVNSEIRLFADDTTVFVTVDNPDQAADLLNKDLENMSEWANQWLIKFSASKTKCMTISNRSNIDHPNLILSNTTLEEVDHYKHLGLVLQSNLSWDKHIYSIVANADKSMY